MTEPAGRVHSTTKIAPASVNSRGADKGDWAPMSSSTIQPGYCQCGCGGKTSLARQTRTKRGVRKGQPARFLAGHNGRRPAITRFWEKVERGDDAECWVWNGTVNGRGYGVIALERQNRPAHRFAYKLLVGPVPDSLVLDHLCRNRRCVNPAHLEPVTASENVIRGVGPTAVNSRKTHCIHGHEFTRENTGIRPCGGRTCLTCKRNSRARTRVAGSEGPEAAGEIRHTFEKPIGQMA